MKRIALIAGARPNFMKIAPIVRALRDSGRGLAFNIVHTGQHYDREMNGVFFEELGIPPPDDCFESGSGTHAEQTAKIMLAFEAYCRACSPDLVLVVGDVNSTLACSIVARKQRIPVAHVEAGLRSFNRAMPEEINRVVADRLSTLLFCPTGMAARNLAREGITEGVHIVGDVMYDAVLWAAERVGSGHHADRAVEMVPAPHDPDPDRAGNAADQTEEKGMGLPKRPLAIEQDRQRE